MTSPLANMIILKFFFWCCFVSIVMFTNYFKFHVNVIPGSVVMTFFYKVLLTKNLENGNSSSEFSPIPRGWGWVRDTKFGKNVSIKMLPNVAKCQGYSFYYPFQLLRERKRGEEITAPLRLRLTSSNWFIEIVVSVV